MSKEHWAYNDSLTECNRDVYEVNVANHENEVTCKSCLKQLRDEQIRAVQTHKRRMDAAIEKADLFEALLI